MTSRRTFYVFTVLLLMFAPNIYGLYNGPDSDPFPAEPTGLIVKFQPVSDLAVRQNANGVLTTGLTAVDRLNRDFRVSEVARLAPRSITTSPKNPLHNVYILSVPPGTNLSNLAAEYAAIPEVLYAEPDYEVELHSVPTDSLYPFQWHLANTGQLHHHVKRLSGYYNDTLIMVAGLPDSDIDYDEVAAAPPDNTETAIVAILDTGVDYNHPDLADNMWVNPREVADNGFDDDHNGYIDDVHGWDASAQIAGLDSTGVDPIDTHGHGTHCAGIVAAVAGNDIGVAGIAPDCRIMALSFHPVPMISRIAEALVYATDNGADVVSMSFGLAYTSELLKDALAYAKSKGVVLCASSGNDGQEAYNFPGSSEYTLAIGATNDSDHVTSFSTFGDQLTVVGPGQSILSLRADGTDIYGSSGNEPDVHVVDSIYYLASGTSMSCPLVAGVAGYIKSLSPGLRSERVQEIIEQSADDILDPYGIGWDLPGWDKYSGHGRVNLDRALSLTPRIGAGITTPQRNEIVSGQVPIDGITTGADMYGYTVDYGVGRDPVAWVYLASGYDTEKTEPLVYWDTDELSAGLYTLRLRVGEDNVSYVTVHVINETALAFTLPGESDTVNTLATVSADGYCDDFSHIQLAFRADVDTAEWEIIAQRSVPAYDDIMLYWLLSGLEAGDYYLRLSLYSMTGLERTDSIRVRVQSLFDSERAWLAEVGEQMTIVPNYGDFDNDGSNEIIVGSLTGIHVYNLDGTPKTEGIPDFPANTFTTPIAVGNLDGDGIDDIVAIGYDPQFVYGWPSSGEPFINHLGIFPPVYYFNNNTENRFPKVFLRDIDGDNRDEIHVYIYDSDVPRALMFDSDGSLLHRFDYIMEYLPADLDGDGLDEIYTMPKRYGMLRQLDAIKGETVDSLLITIDGSEFICQGLTAYDIDHDLKHELIVFGYYYDRGYWLYAFDENLQLKAGWPRDMGMSSFIVPTVPIFGDIDRDGGIEYFTGYFDLDYSYVYAWNIDGTPYLDGSPAAFFAQTPQVSYMNMLLLADLNGDGDAEVVACANNDAFFTYKVQRVYAWDKFGNVLPDFPIVTSQDVTSYYRYIPTIGDMNQDGFVDLTMTTPDHTIAFVNFPGAVYDPCNSPCPHWRYDRSMSNAVIPSCTPTDVTDTPENLPASFRVAQNYPNPFNPSTVIAYSLPARSDVTVEVYDILGRRVRTLTDQTQPAGTHQVTWDGTDEQSRPVASGIYFYRVKTDRYVETRKMTLLK